MMQSSRPVARNRRNLITPPVESWKPPLFRNEASRRDTRAAKLRRFFDLPAGSIWRDLQDILPGCSGNVLDVGCGAQPYRELFPITAVYRGIDTERSSEDFGYVVPDTTHYDGKHWPIADASIDVVLATETLEHIADISEFLGEAARCLRSGGRLVLTVPFAARWHYIPHDYWRFTPSGLIKILEPHGLDATQIWARGNALTVACYKNIALMLPFVFPTARSPVVRLLARMVGFACLPFIALLALVGGASLEGSGGDDCLGYTAVAVFSDARTASTTGVSSPS